jgi:hypothetical protein
MMLRIDVRWIAFNATFDKEYNQMPVAIEITEATLFRSLGNQSNATFAIRTKLAVVYLSLCLGIFSFCLASVSQCVCESNRVVFSSLVNGLASFSFDRRRQQRGYIDWQERERP